MVDVFPPASIDPSLCHFDEGGNNGSDILFGGSS